MGMFWTVLIIQGIIFGGFCSFIASQKNRNSSNWFYLGFLFSILAVLALIAIPKENIADEPDAIRLCPYCAEQVKAQATFCRFCQKDLPVLIHDSPDAANSSLLYESFENLPQQIKMLRGEGFSYHLITQDFNEKKVLIPQLHKWRFNTWTTELVKLVEHE
jgi:hypothetical protein